MGHFRGKAGFIILPHVEKIFTSSLRANKYRRRIGTVSYEDNKMWFNGGHAVASLVGNTLLSNNW